MGWEFSVSHTPIIDLYMKEVQFFRTFNVARILVGNINLRIFFMLLFHYPLFGSTKFIGRMNSKQICVVKKMLPFFSLKR